MPPVKPLQEHDMKLDGTNPEPKNPRPNVNPKGQGYKRSFLLHYLIKK